MIKTLLTMILLTAPFQSFAGQRLVSCTAKNADEVTLEIFASNNGSTVAVVTTDGPGGSYLTSRFSVAQQPSSMNGISTVFAGPNFSLSIALIGTEKPSILTAPSLSIDKMPVVCR